MSNLNSNAAVEGRAPTCRVHGVAMKASRKPGAFYCASRTADGGYCDQKVDAPNLVEYARVYRTFQFSDRSEILSWTHHKLADEVAAFETPGIAEPGEYERVAEALIVLTTFAQSRATPAQHRTALELATGDAALLGGIEEHMKRLFYSINWFHPLTIRRFYAEMRRWADDRETRCAYSEEHRRRSEKGDIPF